MANLVLLLLIFTSACQASRDKFYSDKNKANEVDKALRFMDQHFFEDTVHRVQNAYQHIKQKMGKNFQTSNKQLTLTSFNWKNCGSSGDLATIKSLSVSPDPIPVPGNVTVSFSGSLSQQVSDPVQLNLEIKKKMLFWVPIPCVDNVGSCDYEDICPVIATVPCPPVFLKHNIPCHCPFKSGAYSLSKSVIDISSFGIPSWLEDGDFQVTATLSTKSKQVFCVHVEFSLTK